MIKLLKASSYYPKYLSWLYAKNEELSRLSYCEQHKVIMADCFALSDAWKRHLVGTNTGYDVNEIIINAEILQKKWAFENGVSFRPENWMEDIFIAQFKIFQPNVLYAHAQELGPALRRKCRLEAGSKLFIITYDGIARHTEAVYADSDLVLTCLKDSVDYYRKKGAISHLMVFGFDPSVLNKIDRSLAKSSVTFVGGVGAISISQGHQQRAEMLAYVSKKIKLDSWISGIPSDYQLFKTWAAYGKNLNWKSFFSFPKTISTVRFLRKQSQGELYGSDMFSRLAASQITINMHIKAAGDQAANIRMFEATGVGTCLLTDWKSNIKELFEPDYEIVTYKSVDEAITKIRYLLDNPDTTNRIAIRGQKRTLSQHNYATRLFEVGSLIEKMI